MTKRGHSRARPWARRSRPSARVSPPLPKDTRSVPSPPGPYAEPWTTATPCSWSRRRRTVVRRQTRRAHVDHREETTLGRQDARMRKTAQRRQDLGATPRVFRHHLVHAVLRVLSGRRRGVLHERRRTSTGLLQHQQHRRDERRRPGAVADTPAGHRVGLGQAVDRESSARRCPVTATPATHAAGPRRRSLRRSRR